MLAATCWKAGLPMSAWHDPETRVLAFRTRRVSDAGTGDVSGSW
jgi:AMMECR1 domain-containing protein